MKTSLGSLALSCSMLVLAACVTLGPTPGATGVSAVPSPRPGAELQVGFVPGYYLSSTVVEQPNGDAIPQASALLDVGEAIGAPGLIVAGRAVGESGDTQIEPMLGYRAIVGVERRYAVGAVVHATHASAGKERASYQVDRGGLEVVGDARLHDNRWAELHLFASAAVGVISASGSYCVDGNRTYGVDCPEPPDPPEPRLDAEASGVYPSGTVGLAVDLLDHTDGPFHGARISASLGAGVMPHVVAGVHEGGLVYASAGLALTIGFGSSR